MGVVFLVLLAAAPPMATQTCSVRGEPVSIVTRRDPAPDALAVAFELSGVVMETRQGLLRTVRLEFDQRTMAAIAKGNVEAEVGPWHFSGTEVTFSRDARVSSAAPFELRAGAFVRYQGRGFQWDPVGAVAELSMVSSVVEANEGPLPFQADRIVYLEAQREAQAQGHVTLGQRKGARGVVRFVRGAEGQRVESSSVD